MATATSRHRLYLLACVIVLLSAVSSICFSAGLDFDTSKSLVILPQPRRDLLASIGFHDIDIERLLGGGYVSLGFKVSIPKLGNHSYVMKITGDHKLHYSDTEFEAFDLLNMPPTNPSIPTQVFRIKSMTNPYANWTTNEFRRIGVDADDASWLRKKQNISVQVLTYVPHSHFPDKREPAELARFMRSLLVALNFAHSRNIMNCDIQRRNLHYDNETGTTFLFDWNGAFKFGPNVGIHVEGENKKILPPEAWKGGNETHVTVSGVDVYAAGIVLSKALCGRPSCSVPPSREGNEQILQAHDLAKRMKTADPHERPATEELLKHPFVQL